MTMANTNSSAADSVTPTLSPYLVVVPISMAVPHVPHGSIHTRTGVGKRYRYGQPIDTDVNYHSKIYSAADSSTPTFSPYLYT